jgi:hypothetical protein
LARRQAVDQRAKVASPVTGADIVWARPPRDRRDLAGLTCTLLPGKDIWVPADHHAVLRSQAGADDAQAIHHRAELDRLGVTVPSLPTVSTSLRA